MSAIINKLGQLIQIIHANEEMIKLNTPEGCIAVEDPPSVNNHYYENGRWVEMPERPSTHCKFDYVHKAWVDCRTVEQVKSDKWALVKSERDAIEVSGFEYDGNIYDSDTISQSRIIAAAQLGVPTVWTLKDNSTIELTAQQLNELSQSLALHITSLHERARIARQLINQAENIEQIESITF
ncbi:DUF4376 domain-containing protein [Acinetobacter haemolyticus]|uniref:DUF4376 domain-containing protein n=1 Tax=Acinetobacter haemolyticus TaxID=29430 RepID=UPI0013735C05|nr:DUF4376 domain-containing protein [Acinetobacter haemolyticus]NAS06224.1 DUF4376 domain-containing protein [Acinetobacter haemolyticus]